jgi:undecaprenyl diphosphate synthase
MKMTAERDAAKAGTDPEGGTAIPQHVAIIMDGNGRWARRQGLPRLKGHEAGAESVRTAIRMCREYGIRYLSLYAFSVENWIRPQSEIRGLMRLLRYFLKEREYELHENRVRLRVSGRLTDFPDDVRRELARVEESTRVYDEGQLILCLSYGGRTEIAHAAREIACKARDGQLDPATVDEDTVAAHLYLPDVPDPDLMIRTSGEMRISNFLLWQLSYAELYVTDTMWPEFREEAFHEAIAEYGVRHRRFGDIK